MEIRRKLEILADAAKYDASCSSSGGRRSTPAGGLGNSEGMGICHSYTPDGRCVSLLKILLTNECIYDCRYCVNRVTSDTPRARFTPAEVVRLTLEFYRRNYIEGLFLSSGVLRSPDATMELLIEVARGLREDHGFGGYIHLKATPGVSAALLERAGKLADRLSVNTELPTDADLQALAPEKKQSDVDASMAAIHDRRAAVEADRRAGRKAPLFVPAGQTTQMIVGATPASDRAILAASSRLYDLHALRRVYYSAYSPIPHADARLPAERPPLVREHRLYEADWLVRFYGFDHAELTTDAAPDLPLDLDPKLAWALRHRHLFPVDVHRAPRELLLRVPGLGVRNVERILQARWTILTPDASAHWDGRALHFGPGAPRSAAPTADEVEDMFRSYWRSVFNPARLNLRAMRAEMPKKHWATLPEAVEIPALVHSAPDRTAAMLAPPPSAAAAFVPASRSLPVLRDAAAACTACGLAACATRTVFGEGPATAALMLIGEQPGDEEDLAGRPFVGPAGALLDEQLAAAGLDRRELYVTNAVKHFKCTPRGAQRLHARPVPGEVQACRAWLDAELAAVRPRVIVCLGATAARSFLGPRFNLLRSRGRVLVTPWAPAWLATYHPSAVLRAPGAHARARALAGLQDDLRRAAALVRGEPVPKDSLDPPPAPR
jgi:putative DNA modification/repair radical SAM protein/uracil-DNA glycosylase family protein